MSEIPMTNHHGITIARLDRNVARAEALAKHGGVSEKYNGWQVDWDELRDPHEEYKHEVGVVARRNDKMHIQLGIAKVDCLAECETDDDHPKIVMDDSTDGDPDVFNMASNPGAAVLKAILSLPELLVNAAKVVRIAEDVPEDTELPDCVEALLNAIVELDNSVHDACDVEAMNDA